MWPHIRDGDIITARPLAPGEQAGVGCPVVYLTVGGKVSVHRVVGVHGDLLSVRGDSQDSPPELIRREDVLGLVVLRQRGDATVDLTGSWRSREAALIARGGLVRVHLTRFLRRAHHVLIRRKSRNS
jgi:hypothetical protein